MTRPRWIFRATTYSTPIFAGCWGLIAAVAIAVGNWNAAVSTTVLVWLLLSLRWEQQNRPQPQVHPPAEAMHHVLDQMRVIGDAVDGYRAQMVERGYSDTAAEVMAVEFHRALLAGATREQA